MEQDFQMLLGLMIDESDLSDIQKRIAKEKINLNANISIEDFSKSKLEMKKQIASLGTYIKSTLGDAVTDKQANQWAKKYYDSVAASAKQVIKEQQKINALAKPEQVSATISKINKYMAQNTKITDEAINRLNRYKDVLSEIGVTQNTLNKAKVGLAEIEAQMRSLNKVGFSFVDKFKNAVTKFGGWALATGTVMQGVQKVKEAVVELKEVNTILTEISKTNEKLTKGDLVDLGNIAFKKGSKYGKSASSYLSGVQEASRAGYENADDIAELSVLAQSAGDMTSELANKYVIATDAAYKLKGETEKLNAVLDGQNYITNKNAVSMSDLAEATKVSASQAASSGVDIDKMTAAVSTMIAVTQQGGDVAGRAFKGILMNLQQVSGTVDEETGEIINDDDLRKYEAAANDLGVQLKEVKDGYMALRDPMQVLQELSQAYTSLPEDDAKRANLINAIGGKYRGNQLSAILENWSTYEKMLSEYSQGTGSAMNEAMKSANNWEGSLTTLGNTWTDIVGNFVNSDSVITFLKSLNGALSLVNTTTEKLGSLGTIGTIGAGAGLLAFFKNLDQHCCLNFA